jgi:putative membrane protein
MPVSAQTSKDSRIAEADREMMVDVAQANLAEIATGKLALDKSLDPKIDKFAQQMIDDQTKALDDLKKIAQSKGVEIPSEPDLAHKAMSIALKATTGDFFDKQYIEHAGVGDHRRTIDLLKKVPRESKDADLKSYAGKVLPVVERHLAMARDMNRKQ